MLFGDASGHGMTAGLVMAVAHAAFRTQLDVDPSPQAMFATLNRILCRTGGSRAFFGCVYLLFGEDGGFSASVAGHPPILLDRRRDGAVRERLGRGAYPLGIREGLAWSVEHRPTRLRRAAVPAFRRPLGGAQRLRTWSSATRASRRRSDAASPCRRPALADSVAAEMHSFLSGTSAEDDVSVAVIRRSA